MPFVFSYINEWTLLYQWFRIRKAGPRSIFLGIKYLLKPPKARKRKCALNRRSRTTFEALHTFNNHCRPAYRSQVVIIAYLKPVTTSYICIFTYTAELDKTQLSTVNYIIKVRTQISFLPCYDVPVHGTTLHKCDEITGQDTLGRFTLFF